MALRQSQRAAASPPALATFERGGRPLPADQPGTVQPPAAGVAARLAELMEARAEGIHVHLASSERRADEIGRALALMVPEGRSMVLPAWDCLPGDRASPGRDIMGRRAAAIAALTRHGTDVRILVLAPEALVQRLPPVQAMSNAVFAMRVGERLDRDALARFARATGHVCDDRIDEPGEIAFHGEVIDVYPANATAPVRIALGDRDEVTDIRVFDPLTQRSEISLPAMTLGPASEWIESASTEEAAPFSWPRREMGCEHGLAQCYDALTTVFALLPGARYSTDPKSADRLARFEAQIEEAWRTQRDLGTAEPGRWSAPSSLYLTGEALQAALAGWQATDVDLSQIEAAPTFFRQAFPQRAFRDFVAASRAAGNTIAVVGADNELENLKRLLKRGAGQDMRPLGSWAAFCASDAEGVVLLSGDLEGGFLDASRRRVVIAASDVLGGRLAYTAERQAITPSQPSFRPGDIVLHEDHGIGILRGLKRVSPDGHEQDAVDIEYQGEQHLLAPIEELDRIWRYGADEGAVRLDRLKGEAWPKRRAEISRYVERTAKHLVHQARRRERLTCAPITPPQVSYRAFVDRFAYPETPDQAGAIAAVEQDLAAGRPMDRLVCGDVGFGKTEIALRAAAAVALSGRQVAVVAPTTVLARQHAETFARRFAGTGVTIGQLSRLVGAREAKAVRAGLGDGSLRIVIGTQAIAAKSVAFQDLALMVIDEEQKFGAATKRDLRSKAQGAHVLTLTATPIPRTLQSAMVGIQDLSLLGSPPSRRRPIRTFLAPFDAASFVTALRRERMRGGQSFVVVPRIADIAPLERDLARLVPEMKIRVAHGELAAQQVDQDMVRFADGDGDVLLATNIIESGLDVPRANTIIVVKPEGFGLAQLHQLRGRVGRSRAQGFAYLMHEAGTELGETTRARLEALLTYDRLGSGWALSERDLDLRGAGSLVEDDQAGHIQLVGTDLYQRLLRRALKIAKGEDIADAAPVTLKLGETGFIPETYVADAAIRINLYARLAHIDEIQEIEAFEEELEDRFGEPPSEVRHVLAQARLRCLARPAHVRAISAGPKAIAIAFAPAGLDAARRLAKGLDGAEVKDERLIIPRRDDVAIALEPILEALAKDTAAHPHRRRRKPSPSATAALPG